MGPTGKTDAEEHTLHAWPVDVERAANLSARQVIELSTACYFFRTYVMKRKPSRGSSC